MTIPTTDVSQEAVEALADQWEHRSYEVSSMLRALSLANAALREYVTELEGTLRRIATPHDCGCRPCHCAYSAPAMLIELDEVRSIAAEALK